MLMQLRLPVKPTRNDSSMKRTARTPFNQRGHQFSETLSQSSSLAVSNPILTVKSGRSTDQPLQLQSTLLVNNQGNGLNRNRSTFRTWAYNNFSYGPRSHLDARPHLVDNQRRQRLIVYILRHNQQWPLRLHQQKGTSATAQQPKDQVKKAKHTMEDRKRLLSSQYMVGERIRGKRRMPPRSDGVACPSTPIRCLPSPAQTEKKRTQANSVADCRQTLRV